MIQKRGVIETDVDKLFTIIKSNPNLTVEQLASRIKVPIDTINLWIDFLEDEGLIKIEYKFTKAYVRLIKHPGEETPIEEEKETEVLKVKKVNIPETPKQEKKKEKKKEPEPVKKEIKKPILKKEELKVTTIEIPKSEDKYMLPEFDLEEKESILKRFLKRTFKLSQKDRELRIIERAISKKQKELSTTQADMIEKRKLKLEIDKLLLKKDEIDQGVMSAKQLAKREDALKERENKLKKQVKQWLVKQKDLKKKSKALPKKEKKLSTREKLIQKKEEKISKKAQQLEKELQKLKKIRAAKLKIVTKKPIKVKSVKIKYIPKPIKEKIKKLKQISKKPTTKKTKQVKSVVKKIKPKPIKKKKVRRKPKEISLKIPTNLNNKQQINKMIFICRQFIKRKQLKEAQKYLRDIKSKLKKIKLDEITKNILKEELMIVDNDIKLKSLDMR